MPIHLLSACWTPASSLLVWLLALPLPAPPKLVADDAPQPAKAHLVTQTYQVADLVVPIPRVVGVPAGPARAATATEEDQLIKLITSAIEPKSWSDNGGSGTVDYHPLTMSLVVCQTPDIQEQIVDLLSSLRRLQDTQASLEMRFISVSESCAERLGLDGKDGMEIPSAVPSAAPLRVTFLKDAQVYRLLVAAQGDCRTNIMQTPKLTLFNGQTALLDLTQPQDPSPPTNFINDFTPNHEASPEVLKAPIGLRLTAKPVVSADQRFVRLNLNVGLTTLDSTEPVRVGVFQNDDNPSSQSATAKAQPPHLSQLALDCMLKIPDGGTAVISGWKRDREVRTEHATPILSEIPYLNRLFTNVGYAHEKECILLLVTPRVIVPPEEEEKVAPSKVEAPGPRVCTPIAFIAPPECKSAEAAALVAKYQQACADGHLAEATQFAVQALAIDPACFRSNVVQLQPCDAPPPACVTSSPKK